MAGRIYPLFMLQDPRRNLYAPIYGAWIPDKEIRGCFIIISVYPEIYNCFNKKLKSFQKKESACSSLPGAVLILSTDEHAFFLLSMGFFALTNMLFAI